MNKQHQHKKVLLVSFAIILTFMVLEAVGGILTNSLALLSDAGHMLSDAVSLGIALVAIQLAERAATKAKTYGYMRVEIIASTVNGLTLIGIALWIFYEAWGRFANPPAVATTGMLIISTIGLLVNLFVAWYMVRGADTEGNLNMRGAYLHVLSDILGSIGAIIAGLCIVFWGWSIADPVASVVVALLVLRSGVKITRMALHILLEGTPTNVDVAKIEGILTNHPQVQSMHHLHVWTITSGLHALTCHLVVDAQMTVQQSTALLHQLEHQLSHEAIQHVTIQVETAMHHHDKQLFCQARPAIDPHAGHNH